MTGQNIFWVTLFFRCTRFPTQKPIGAQREYKCTSAIKTAVILQVVPVVIADLLLRVGEDSEGLTHFFEFLFLLLLHLWCC